MINYINQFESIPSTVFIVDDQATSLNILKRVIQAFDDNIQVKCFYSATKALMAAESSVPDMVITDYKMPDLNGAQFIKKFRENIHCRYIPIIAITVLDDINAKYKALEAGANDFLVKPIDIHECEIRCHNLLSMQKQRIVINKHSKSLETKIQQATNEVISRELEILSRLAKIGEYRCNITGKNMRRMGYFTSIIAEEMGINEDIREALKHSAAIHDIGKVGIPDSILMKPGPLTKQEFNTIKSHTNIGYDILKESPSPYLKLGATIALQHHEKFDGSGYPFSLKGKEIAIETRISTIADVFDALISKRPYKEPWPIDRAYDYIRRDSGTHFDPDCVQAFLNKRGKINETIEFFCKEN